MNAVPDDAIGVPDGDSPAAMPVDAGNSESATSGGTKASIRRFRVGSTGVLCLVLVAAMVGQPWLGGLFNVPALRTGSTVFVAICVQALPFLVLGVLISGAIAAFVPARLLRKALPRNEKMAVSVAGLAGMALPGCECASVPVARRLIGQGVAPAAALTFLLAAPAINPVVLVATAVAFPGNPEMVLARFLGSLATAVAMGLLWSRWGKSRWFIERALQRLPETDSENRLRIFTETARADLVDAGGFLVLGALLSATVNILVPAEWFAVWGNQLILSVLVMAVLAVVLALCSEADAFVAASFAAMPLLPKLVFLVVGPAVDLKLFALQAGTFGRSFALRFAPATFAVAIACATAVGFLVVGTP